MSSVGMLVSVGYLFEDQAELTLLNPPWPGDRSAILISLCAWFNHVK